MAMSGGFDSSFAAYLLKKEGYNVVGVTFRLLPELSELSVPAQSCKLTDAEARAHDIANRLSIPHYVFDLREDFEYHVIKRFIAEYKSGKTPNPCILCNKFIKFSTFAKKAFSMGADRIATGHYAVIEKRDGNCYLKKGVDRTKDQSYFLYAVEQDILKKTLFPLGMYHKNYLKEESKNMSLNIHSIKDSQDICFISGNSYGDFLSSHTPSEKGPIYHVNGTFLGTHKGLHFYTIGQRKGINIPYKEALYVVNIIPAENTLIVGNKDDLMGKALIASDIAVFPGISGDTKGKVRYRQKEVPCVYNVVGEKLYVEFLHPVSSITPGQSIVLYHNDTVVAGGVIEKRIDS